MSGKDALSELRGWSTVPVIILSVRADERKKVKALDVGANDYVTKPFGLQKFLARVPEFAARTNGARSGSATNALVQ